VTVKEATRAGYFMSAELQDRTQGRTSAASCPAHAERRSGFDRVLQVGDGLVKKERPGNTGPFRSI